MIRRVAGAFCAFLALAGIATLLLAGEPDAAAQERPARPARPVTPVDYITLPQRAVIAPVVDCAALSGRSFAHVKEGPAHIQSAKVEPAAGDRAEFCLVKGYVAPTIQFELRLPTKSYTGRYLQGGCGGNCGMIPSGFAPSCDTRMAYAGAFALGFEDSGHQGGGGAWALSGEQAKIDFSYRAAHVFSVAAKAIIADYYGQAPAFSYFQGCSDGGREALAEAQRYPDDFDGIVAGSPAHIISQGAQRFMWEAKTGLDDQSKPIFDRPALEALHAAVMGACDSLDGLKDGQIDDPRQCKFDPRKIQCKPGAAAGSCLTPAQAEAAIAYYKGPVDAATGKSLYPSGQPYSSELSWAGRPASGRNMMDEFMRYLVFQGELPASTNVRNWKFDEQTSAEINRRGAVYNTNNPDLRPLNASGGKLIIWHGAADNSNGVYGTTDYYQRVQNVVGGLEATRSFARFFMVPGVAHCGGGYMPFEQNMLGAIVDWVERGNAPDKILSTALLPDGKIRKRPVFAYPVRAKYTGKGDINDARNFIGVSPSKKLNDLYDWVGAPEH